MSKTQARLVSFAGRMLAIAALTTTGGALLYAQTAQSGPGAPAATAAAQTVSQVASQNAAAQAAKLSLQLPASLTNDAAVSSSSPSSSSSSSDDEMAANTTDQLHFMDAMQYGGGNRRYGRPRYRGGNTNADGSPKYDFYVGGGFGIAAGTQSNYLTPSWGMQLGGGRMFNKNFGVNLEFAYDNFGMTSATIQNQSQLYFQDTAGSTGLDANSHVWSLGIQPIYNIRSGEGLGAYITGGGGYYHKVANFTLPEEEEYCDEYYGICEPIEVNGIFDHYSSNSAGLDGGFGITYKFSRFASERLYAEVRVVHTFNQYKPANYTTGGWNFFPQNSQHTTYVPVKFGLRF